SAMPRRYGSPGPVTSSPHGTAPRRRTTAVVAAKPTGGGRRLRPATAIVEAMIEVHELTKRYGSKTAVDGLSFTVKPGIVTGFLGPNGAGKSTTMRMIVGLDAPTEGTVTVNGRHYAQHPAPLREVGALLEAKAVHTGRSAY